MLSLGAGKNPTEAFHQSDSVRELHLPGRTRCAGQCHAEYVNAGVAEWLLRVTNRYSLADKYSEGYPGAFRKQNEGIHYKFDLGISIY